jgi:signal transduction histidine kinase
MALKRRNVLVYALALGVWALVVAWQADEHARVKEAARTELRNRSRVFANFLSAVIRGQRFRGAILQERLEPVLNELANERTNEMAGTSELLSIALLNTAGEPVVSAGKPISQQEIKEIIQDGEHWWPTHVGFVNLVEGASERPPGATNPTVILPSPREFTNALHQEGIEFPRREPTPGGPPPEPPPGGPNPEPRLEGRDRDGTNTAEAAEHRHGREAESHPRRPPWLRWMDEAAFESLIARRELHGLVLSMSTDTIEAVCLHDLWLRGTIAFFAGLSVIGVALAWRNLAKSSELQIRLVRASEMNTHLRDMNLAAAGLAHETRNPLNIVRGLAQMISRRPDAAPEIRTKSREIIDETDKVTAQLNEFINYSRPRELRRSVIALAPVMTEVVRALNFDIEEKRLRVDIAADPIAIEADEQLLRQVLFNLLLNAIQAVGPDGRIEIQARRNHAGETSIEVRDDGPGVPIERRVEIFKPYFTTNQKGTGLGLAIVQQIVLAHGWEIECLSNEPHGAVFRITHLKLAARR